MIMSALQETSNHNSARKIDLLNSEEVAKIPIRCFIYEESPAISNIICDFQ